MNKIIKFVSEQLSETTYHIYHKSGLFISYVPKKKAAFQAVLYVNFGGRHERYSINGEDVTLPMGCAHFLEHKMFDNPDGKSSDAIITSLGGYCNAFTSSTKTAYYFSTTENFYECLSHLIKFVTTPYFTEQSVEKEVGIIAEEIRGCVDDPYDRCHINLLSAMYHKNTAKNEICGTEESISRITPEILYKCCEHFYTPENMSLCISGDLDVDKIVETVDAVLPNFSKFDAREINETEPQSVASKFVSAQMPLGKPIFCIGIKINDIPTDKRERLKQSAALDIFCRMIFSQSENFYLDMLDKKLISHNFDAGASTTKTFSYVSFSGESDDPKKLARYIRQKIREVKQKPLDAVAFERELRCDYASFVSDFDSTEDISFMLMSYASGKDEMNIFEYLDILNSIDIEYIEQLIKRVLNEENMSLSVIYPT
ncbi:MAG: insulinase family protein [Ruminococcaceae bacterium]|nr:insulinase family protein [Oscillospiraceae bacterium]